MSTGEFITSAWELDLDVLMGWAGALAVYVAIAAYGKGVREAAIKGEWLARSSGGRLEWNRVFWLGAGLGICVLTLISPINALAKGYLFSAHMLQHLLLLLVIPPLLLLSLPRWVSPTEKPHDFWNRLERGVTLVPVTWLAGSSAMWLWHAPTLCNAATTSQPIHGLQVFTLLLMGGLFWWPICGPQLHRRLNTLTGVIYLFSACIACTLLGILITFSPVEVCSVFLHPEDRLGILPLIRNDWRITPGMDQQVGGLLMWIPACSIYLSVIVITLIRWFAVGAEEPILDRPLARMTTETKETQNGNSPETSNSAHPSVPQKPH